MLSKITICPKTTWHQDHRTCNLRTVPKVKGLWPPGRHVFHTLVVHRNFVNLHQYLADWLLRSLSLRGCLLQTQFVVNLASWLRLLVNKDKSDLILTELFTFLGETYDLVARLVAASEDMLQKIALLGRIFRRTPYQTACAILRLLGMLSSIADVVSLGLLHIRPLQLYLISQ